MYHTIWHYGIIAYHVFQTAVEWLRGNCYSSSVRQIDFSPTSGQSI